MIPDLPPCEYDGCDTPTQEHLCHTCVTELQADWDQIPDLLPTLKAISRGEDVAFHLPTGEKRSGGGGSRPPINLSALQLHADLEYAHTITPHEWARDQAGPRYKRRIHAWVDRAHKMVHGEKETKDTPEYQALRVKANGLEAPMSPTQAIQYLAESQAQITDLTEDTIRQWKHRGKINDYTIKEIYREYEKRPKTVL